MANATSPAARSTTAYTTGAEEFDPVAGRPPTDGGTVGGAVGGGGGGWSAGGAVDGAGVPGVVVSGVLVPGAVVVGSGAGVVTGGADSMTTVA